MKPGCVPGFTFDGGDATLNQHARPDNKPTCNQARGFPMAAAFRSVFMVILTTFAFGAGGFLVADAPGYGIAFLTGRPPPELKNVLIWCFIFMPLVSAAAGFWLAIRRVTERVWLRRFAAATFMFVTSCAVVMIVWSYLEAPRYN